MDEAKQSFAALKDVADNTTPITIQVPTDVYESFIKLRKNFNTILDLGKAIHGKEVDAKIDKLKNWINSL